MGKSALALELSHTFPLEVVNADSRQVYQGLDIGTAKPSGEDRTQVPHHLIDIVVPDEPFTLALFLDQAHAIISDVQKRGRIPLVVGGTGQYVWGLLEQWQMPRVPPDEALRSELEHQAEEEGRAALHERLMALDPEAAMRIHPRNLRRVVRALEVYTQTGKPAAQKRRELSPNTLIIGLTLPRNELYRRIDIRVEAMLEAGWLQELRHLLIQGYTPDLPALSSVGYRELALYVQNQLSWEETVRRIKTSTHRLVRHQYTWFRLQDPRIHWFDASADVADQAASLVRYAVGQRAKGTWPVSLV